MMPISHITFMILGKPLLQNFIHFSNKFNFANMAPKIKTGINAYTELGPVKDPSSF